MRFMMFVKANKDSEARLMPKEELIAQMTRYNEELTKAGVLFDLAGCSRVRKARESSSPLEESPL
jgi:hypothetical protein